MHVGQSYAKWSNIDNFLELVPSLIDTLVPGTADLPSGMDAGVDEYVVVAITRYRKSDLPAWILVCGALDFVAHRWFSTRFSELALVERTMVARSVERTLPSQFVAVRNTCLEGYFAHPRWRAGRGQEIWPGIGFRPVLRRGAKEEAQQFELLENAAMHEQIGERESYSDDIRDY